MTHSSAIIQIAPESAPTIPPWMGEVAAVAQVLTHIGLLKVIQDQVRFARARFGHYDLIDFVVVLIGYVVYSNCSSLLMVLKKEETHGSDPTVLDHLVDRPANGHVRWLFAVGVAGSRQPLAYPFSGNVLPGWSRPCRGLAGAFFRVLGVSTSNPEKGTLSEEGGEASPDEQT